MPCLPVVVPLVVAALLLAARPMAGHRRTLDLIAVGTSAAVAVVLGILIFRTDHASTYWFAGFRPAHGIAVGIAFTVGLAGLYWRRIPVLRGLYEPGARGAGIADRFQSGVINDYITWVIAGLACLGGVLAAIIR